MIKKNNFVVDIARIKRNNPELILCILDDVYDEYTKIIRNEKIAFEHFLNIQYDRCCFY